jgi:hypothetical protein
MIKFIKKLIEKIQKRKREKEFKKKLEEIRKRDPFIYNH